MEERGRRWSEREVRFEGEMGFGRYRGRKGWRVGWRRKQGHGNGHDLVGRRVTGVVSQNILCVFWAILSSALDMAKLLVRTLL